jgi:hypothetical protein
MGTEIWKDVIIDGIKYPYQVSNNGIIKSLPRLIIAWNRFKNVERMTKEMILKPASDNRGYKIGYSKTKIKKEE